MQLRALAADRAPPIPFAGARRLLLVWGDEHVSLAQQGVTVWVRDEALAGERGLRLACTGSTSSAPKQ